MSESRLFPTTAAGHYDRGLHKSLKIHPPPPHVAVPQPACCWPEENVTFPERYRAWLVSIGAAEAVINQHHLPMAGHVLGLNLKPHRQINLFDKALCFVQARTTSERWQ